MRVEYNDGDWETTPEGKDEASTGEEVNESDHATAAVHASMAVCARPPLGLLSVKLREHREKENFGTNGSKNEKIPKEGRFASPGMPSVPIPLLTLCVAKQSAPVSKADIPQGPPPVMKYSKAIAESNVEPRKREEESEGCLQTEQASCPGCSHSHNGGEGESPTHLL